MPAPPLLDARNLRRRVAELDRPLLDVDRFSITGGERIGLAGPTGSGKSTLLRALVMLDPCDGCQLFFQGRPVDEDSVTDFRRDVIYLPQRPTLIAGSVRDNLRLPFAQSASDSRFDESAVSEMFEDFAKDHSLLDQSSEMLSGGERQIVALIRAIQLRPKILLLDEPTASLDDRSAFQLEAAVTRWYESTASDGVRALVFASHRVDQIERMTDRRVTIEYGRIVEPTGGSR